LREPSREIGCVELAAALEAVPQMVSRKAAGESQLLSDTGPMFDPQAKSAYRKRLSELREEHEEAQRLNDSGTVARARREIEALEQELSRSLGIGGRERRKGSQASGRGLA
jgi:hypothetical protein